MSTKLSATQTTARTATYLKLCGVFLILTNGTFDISTRIVYNCILHQIGKRYLKAHAAAVQASPTGKLDLVSALKLTQTAFEERNNTLLTLRSWTSPLGLIFARLMKPDVGRPLIYYLDNSARRENETSFEGVAGPGIEAKKVVIIHNTGLSSGRANQTVNKVIGVGAVAMALCGWQAHSLLKKYAEFYLINARCIFTSAAADLPTSRL
ncbi:hypothetical protein RQP46_005662 [Phenoliferia psychrophenolica]